MAPDVRNALIYAHQKNINRYSGLLAMDLTEQEREYIHRRISEQRLEIERLRRLATS